MKTALTLTGTLTLGLLLAPLVLAADAETPRATIDRAIQALGGKEKLAKYKAATFKEKGTFYGMGDGVAYTGNYSVLRPGHFRMEIEGVFLMIFDGEKGWMQQGGGEAGEMTAEQVEEQKADRYAEWVSTLLPLDDDKKFTLTSLGEAKVEDQPAVGIKVTSKGQRDVSIYFDKKTGLPVKSEYRAKALEDGGKEVTQEVFIGGHKDVDGIKIPTKIHILRDGKKFIEAEVLEYKLHETLDKKLFAKP